MLGGKAALRAAFDLEEFHQRLQLSSDIGLAQAFRQQEHQRKFFLGGNPSVSGGTGREEERKCVMDIDGRLVEDPFQMCSHIHVPLF
jgi:hypothetical protein